MKRLDSLDGPGFRSMLANATAWLERSAPDIDAINVFPVPDGDTGTNMLLTMRSALEEAGRSPDDNVATIAAAFAHGALMGARGNSGVILSQFFRGISQALGTAARLNAEGLSTALVKGSESAYCGLSKPAEGTMLTVMREAAQAAIEKAKGGAGTNLEVLTAAVGEARQSVARTPQLLPALKEAGVVDAGGQGIYVILEGALKYLKGETDLGSAKAEIVEGTIPLALRIGKLSADKEEPYGYCTEFIIERNGKKLNTKRIMARINKQGQSVVVVGDETMVRVHVHTLDPGAALSYGLSIGTLHGIKVNNMDDQNKEFVRARKGESEATGTAVIAVATGEGLVQMFGSLGAVRVVEGGQTMNPSVSDLVKAVDSTDAAGVILLPNNRNVVPSAMRVRDLTTRKVVVVPTESIPQGIAAILAFNFEKDLEENGKAMLEAARRIRTVEVTRAARSTRVSGLRVRKGQVIGLLDDRLVKAGQGVPEVLHDTLSHAGMDSAELVTLYYGAGTEKEQAETLSKDLAASYPSVEFQVVAGGQPYYDYIASLE